MGGVFPEGVWLRLHPFLSGGMLPNLEAATQTLYDSQYTQYTIGRENFTVKIIS